MRMMNENESAGSGMFLLGAAAGALVGAAVALLMAPKAGTEMRQDINAGWSSLREAAARRYREMADRAGVQLDNIEEKADQLADQLESSAREAVDAASSRLGAAASRAASTIRDASAGGPTNPRNS
ncbi:MAG: YtxH domain-containing protein [Acidobacteriota bacterium]|nr:YtxH domain-containing protein [Acidobacteriota bacterium]